MLTLLLAGCAATPNRPVDTGPEAEALAALLRRPEPAGPTLGGLAVVVVTPGPREAMGARTRPALFVPPKGAAPEHLRVPLDDGVEVGAEPPPLGLPLRVDFGVGEAPYDDGTLPLHRGAVGRSGFSDSFLSLEWRSPVTRALAVSCRAAFVREQDTALLEGLGDARLGFIVLGCGVSF